MCYQPITIKTPQGYKTVPCGKCLECLRKYQSDWSNRMFEELKVHNGKAVFFTLTYSDENIPKNYLYYSSPTTYEIFRSPSDYAYDNTKIRQKGERKKVYVRPDIDLVDLGIEYQVIDFNVKRKDQKSFRNHILKIYGEYMKNFVLTTTDRLIEDCDGDDWDFDMYDGDYFGDQDQMMDLFHDYSMDDEYDETPQTFPNWRERPVMMFNSVRKKDVQDWIKRARQRRVRESKKTGKPVQDFSFFITSEYGPRTLRPHYHGVLFGVSAKETWDMCTDWQKHFGTRISWEDVDLSKGDMSYCAKYCSKGFYEHPLCSKNFFYPKPLKVGDEEVRPFSEYHSKHYERCIELFGIDAPIVDPTFHLVSKGMGVHWCEEHKALMDDLQDFTELKYDSLDSSIGPSIQVIYTPGDPHIDEFIYDIDFTDSDVARPINTLDIIQNENYKDYGESISRLFDKFKYSRVFKGQTVTYGVPKYYREKMFSDALRYAFTNYVQSRNVEIYQQKLEELRKSNPTWKDSEIISAMEAQDRSERVQRMRRVRERLEKQYNKSKI